jgi:hypothetical protein
MNNQSGGPMRGPRFDQYESPSFRSILTSLGLWCVALITPVLAFYFFILTEDYASLAPFLIILCCGLIVLCCGAFYVLYKRQKEYAASYQARRDEAAIKIFNAVRSSSDEQKFAIFLRPFYTTDKIKSREMIPVPVQVQGPSGPITIMNPVPMEHGLEDAIVKAFSRTMPVVALGKPGETFGVGRILVDEESWQKAATQLMDHAALIIFQPSSHPGSFWEVKQIVLDHYLCKTVFIMPPDPQGWKELRGDWELLKKNMASSGITLPEYQADGLLFSVDAKGQCISEKLRLGFPGNLLEMFIRLSSPVIRGRG